MIKGVALSAEHRIRKLQPFQRGASAQEDALRVLQELNNTDKHRLLIVASAVLNAADGVKITLDKHFAAKGEAILIPNPDNPLIIVDGTEVVSVVTENPEAQADVKITPTVAIKEVCLPQLYLAIPLLTQLSGYVSRILTSFEAEFA